MKPLYPRTLALAAALAFSNSAWAHHPIGGETPSTLWQGLLSGLGHPIIGIDHLAFIVAIGLLSAFARLRSPVFPLALVAATVLGASLQWSGVTLPYVETLVAASVVVAGLLVFRSPKQLKTVGIASSLAAVFHGMAYGEAIIGAEPAPLGAYLLGFSMIQMAIAGLAFTAGHWALRNGPSVLRITRGLSASAISGIGLIALSTTVLA
jgi:urease accessory protein